MAWYVEEAVVAGVLRGTGAFVAVVFPARGVAVTLVSKSLGVAVVDEVEEYTRSLEEGSMPRRSRPALTLSRSMNWQHMAGVGRSGAVQWKRQTQWAQCADHCERRYLGPL